MTFQEIEYILTLCEERNFSVAASKLFITQQGLSKAIKKLEQELMFPLFERTKQGLVLTQSGEDLYPTLLEYRAMQARLEKRIEEIRQSNRKIHLGVIMGVLLVIPDVTLDALIARLAPYTLQITETTDIDCEDLVENGRTLRIEVFQANIL